MSRPMDENDRLLPVDAVRGIAMFFIGVSHISFYLINDSGILATNARAIGFLASPNFLLMSGLACGYQLAHSPTTATALRIVQPMRHQTGHDVRSSPRSSSGRSPSQRSPI